MKNMILMVAVGALTATVATAQTPPQPAAPADKKMASTESSIAASDKAFVKEAAIGGMAEVELGTLAKEKASSPDVKQFGDRMVTDHSKANDELKQWAQQKNVTLPTEVDAKSKATHDRLAKLSGDAFDKAYMADMVSDHIKDVAAFKRESTGAKDPDLKAWAGKTLPTLQDHLKQAKDVQAKVGKSSAEKTEATPKH